MLLHERLKSYHLLLATHSPRRRELLSGCGLPYTLAPAYEVKEEYPQGMSPEKVPEYLSGLKSDAYPHRLAPDEILLTADTAVIDHGTIFGKPDGFHDAFRMLCLLSGHSHTVVTGVTIRSATKRKSFSSSSEVCFRSLDPHEIEYYIRTYCPYDKAGAYGIQEWIGYVAIESIQGSFYNVMGLPIQKVYAELDKFINE